MLHRWGRRSVCKQRRINRISKKFRYVHQCHLIRMMQRTHRIRWMYFEVVSQSASPMNWYTKSWMSFRTFIPARTVTRRGNVFIPTRVRRVGSHYAHGTQWVALKMVIKCVLWHMNLSSSFPVRIIWLKKCKGLLHSIYFHPSLEPLSVARYSPGLCVTRSWVSFYTPIHFWNFIEKIYPTHLVIKYDAFPPFSLPARAVKDAMESSSYPQECPHRNASFSARRRLAAPECWKRHLEGETDRGAPCWVSWDKMSVVKGVNKGYFKHIHYPVSSNVYLIACQWMSIKRIFPVRQIC